MPYRNKTKLIKFSQNEWDAVCSRAENLGKKTATYIREMSVQGVIKNYDMQHFNHLVVSFNRIANELNQIAKIANSTQSVYAKDIEDMKKSFNYLNAVFENYLLPLKEEVV